MAATTIQQLANLDPKAQTDAAIGLLKPRTRRDVLMAALEVLAQTPSPASRPALINLYAHFADQQGKRDQAGYIRRGVLEALRSVAKPADTTLLLAAVNTYEFPPPSFTDDAGPLRAAALVVLTEVDDELSRFHAARLLADGEHTEEMSGEPGVTAARVLGAQQELTALFLYAAQPSRVVHNEVLAECLRQLTGLPEPMVASLITRHGEADDAIILLGLFDLLLSHEDGPTGIDYINDFLATTLHYDVYRYLVTAMIASGDGNLLNTVLASARYEGEPEKVAILIRALALMAGSSAVDETIEILDDRLNP